MTTLKGYPIPAPKYLCFPLSKELSTPGFRHIQTYYPGIGILCQLRSPPKEDIWFDHTFRAIQAEGDCSKSSGPVALRVEKNIDQSGVEVQDISGFRKITHLLDPIHWIQGKYSLPKHVILPWHQASWGAAWHKLQDPMNQAYVEALATYAFSKLRENDYTPHFHRFFGCFCCIADSYSYNITDSYMSYRNTRWFWNGQEQNSFRLTFDQDVPDEVKEAILVKPEELHNSDSESDTTSAAPSEEELSDLDASGDVASIHSADMGSFHSIDSATENSATDTEGEVSEEEDSDDEDLNIFAEIRNFPVMVIYTESSEGTMDDLLDAFDIVKSKPGSAEWERTWSAWIFQVIAALCIGQAVFGFTHNDLHSNNIVWGNTDQEFLYYRTRDGITFQIPTFGKIFRLIDFGRSIYRINDALFFSDEFRPGNDAAEQYNFGEFMDSKEPEVLPNPSFDLSRFTVSVFESIFPSSPPVRKDGTILSDEPGLKIKETESDLYNMLWSWLLCDDGHNVLMEPDGKERYPDFDLYKIISAKVHNAVPSDQVRKPIFEQFRIASAPEGKKVYSLFC